MARCHEDYDQALSAFRALDANNNGVLSRDELSDFFMRFGLTEKQMGPLLLELDQAEWLKGWDAIVAISGRAKFRDLQKGCGCQIEDSSMRAASLEQLERLYSHSRRRLSLVPWRVKRKSRNTFDWKDELVEELKSVTMLDLYEHVIKPGTLRALRSQHCSLVELMAEGEQPAEFFVSYWS